MRALLTGISGQTGSYLAEHLLKQNIEVFGIIRRNSISEHQDSRIAHLPVETFYGDLLDASSVDRIMAEVKPDFIFNMAAQSFVRVSFEIPHFTANVNSLGALNMLEAYRRHAPNAKYLQASSSEQFGNSIDSDGYQREKTPMRPVSPYGCSKLFAYHLTRVYRESYDLHACSSISFNHESPRRGVAFITQKVVRGAIDIKQGRAKVLELGNLESKRDWNHASDIARAQIMIAKHTVPYDWVVASGVTHSVRELCEYVFTKLGMNYEDHIVIKDKHKRPNELEVLKGDSSQIRNVLGWKPEYTFEMLIDEMISAYL